MKITLNLPYIEKIGQGAKKAVTAPKRAADDHLKKVMAQAMLDVANTMQENLKKEQA